MRHRVFGRILKRSTNERRSLFRNLSRSCVLHGKITTTYAKAKAVQPFLERLVTRAKVNSLTSRRILLKRLVDEKAVNKLLNEIGPLFKNRDGGYTRIIKLKRRVSDDTLLVLLSFTESVANSEIKVKAIKEEKKKDTTSPKKRKTEKKTTVKS